MIDCAEFCIGRCKLELPLLEPKTKQPFQWKNSAAVVLTLCIFSNHPQHSLRLEQSVTIGPFHVNIIAEELTEYTARTAGNERQWKSRSRPEWSLTGGELWEHENISTKALTLMCQASSEANASSQVASNMFFPPVNSFPPASVNNEFMTSSASQLPSLSSTWVSIRLRTSSRVAARSSKRMFAWARKLSRSLWARTSSWKFIGFTYWCENDKGNLWLMIL